MIEPVIAADLSRIAASERDVRGAFQPGFEPESNVVARPPKVARTQDPLSVAAPEGAYFLTADRTGTIRFRATAPSAFETVSYAHLKAARRWGSPSANTENSEPYVSTGTMRRSGVSPTRASSLTVRLHIRACRSTRAAANAEPSE